MKMSFRLIKRRKIDGIWIILDEGERVFGESHKISLSRVEFHKFKEKWVDLNKN
jgi:hypothetical protein